MPHNLIDILENPAFFSNKSRFSSTTKQIICMSVISGSHSGLLSRSRPKSAYCGVATAANEPLENAQDEVEKPILRRERTFDLDPKPNTASKIVEVNIDIEPEAENDSGNQVDHNNIQQEEGKEY